MQDDLKQFVDAHRDALDIYQPREQLWEGIEERLQNRPQRKRWQWLAVAASLLFVLSCGTWILLSQQRNKAQESVSVTPKLNETEVYFTALLQMKDAELDQYCRPQPELCREFEMDLEKLQGEYRMLKSEYTSSIDKHEILRAMAANLQMQVQLVNEQLHIMEVVQTRNEKFKTI